MSIFKCKMCGGTIEFEQGATVGVCDSCGTKQTLPRLDDDRRANLYDRANHFRRNNEFDKAAAIYEQILTEDTTDAEAYWSLVLCQYGIEYVEDPATRKRVPTVNRAQFTSIFDDDNYKSAIQYADGYQRELYEKEAKTINDIQKGILAISQKEEPFDVFICYKETDNNGRRTQDSVLSNDLYHQLTQEGFKVFFSRITLEDKLGTAYEPYIFAALNSAKVMVVLGTKPEYFNAVWVKNEWGRYLALVKKSGGKKVLIPAYRDMNPYDLPEEFSHLQAQDMSKLGFMQDLIRGIKKIAKVEEPKATVKETVVVSGNTNVAPLLKRAFIFLEDGNWAEADEYCEKVLDQDPENAEAYVGKLMAELHVRRQEHLSTCEEPFDDSNNYQKAIRFGDDIIIKMLVGAVDYINDRNKNTRLSNIFSNAVKVLNSARTEKEFKNAANAFQSIPGYKKANELAKICIEKAEICRKDEIYAAAISRMHWSNTISSYEEAIKEFNTISGWKDADEKVNICKRKIEEIKAKEEAIRLERERRAEQWRTEAEKRSKRNKKTAAIVIPVIAVINIIAFLIPTVIIPTEKYNHAVGLYNAAKYDEAITAFKELNGYKDSEAQITKCENAIINTKYNTAIDLYNAGKYDEAITAFKALNGYKDSEEQIEKCENAIKDKKYNDAINLYNTGKYDEAITAFKALNGYKDSTEQITKSETAIKDFKYNSAIKLYNDGKYDEAITAFKALNGYKDSAEQITKSETAIKDGKYNSALDLYNAGKYDEAITAFNALNGYKDSATQLEKCYIGKYGEEKYNLIKLIKNIKVGDTYKFGSYEQNNKTSDGKEEIEWIVLEKDGMSLLLISKYALDCQQYNTSFTDVTWETCSLRKWLNVTFINNAFSTTEQNMIQSTTVTADKNPSYSTSPGNNTTDKVFLLSITEANKYFSSDSARQCQGTAYCYAQGVYESNGNCSWWLRSPGFDSDEAALVYIDGSVYGFGDRVHSDYDTVRPALWINLGP